ncbi:MAG TPA: hypothetical protein DEB39_12385 [Planctomycetaceae bacterium]|nr:hypothetical protein [Planctomycetaceae bacterium]
MGCWENERVDRRFRKIPREVRPVCADSGRSPIETFWRVRPIYRKRHDNPPAHSPEHNRLPLERSA